MARSRVDLGKIFHQFVKHVYFQPTEKTKIEYPCIIYERAAGIDIPADNIPYLMHMSYNVTVIDKDPDSEIPSKVRALPLCTFNRHFVTENLHHDIFTIYF